MICSRISALAHASKGSETMDDTRFRAAIAAFDAVHARDPAHPRALLEAERLSACIERLDENASLALRLAARCQHLERWAVPRETYAQGRLGYLKWRKDLARFHADRAAQILRDVGYDEAAIAAVRSIVLKQDLKQNRDTQTMEDALCLVFLEHELEAFLDKYPDEAKAVDILQKTWCKMSERGHAAALSLSLSARGAALVGRALAEPAADSD
jgi:hypothetical protein